jgi:beta-lactamase superfamily II metal-dependent hydrolase
MVGINSRLSVYPVMERIPGLLYVHFLPRHRGDNIIIQVPLSTEDMEYSNVLIDCNKYSDDTRNIIKNDLGIQEIHHVIITHADADHVGGMGKIIEEFKDSIIRVYLPSGANVSRLKQLVKKLRKIKDIYHKPDPFIIWPSDKYSMNQGINITLTAEDAAPSSTNPDAVMMRFHGPTSEFISSDTYKQIKDKAIKMNESSLVFSLSYYIRNLIFPGDTGNVSWKQSVKGMMSVLKDSKEKLIMTTLLKLSHHGSSLSFPKDLLSFVGFTDDGIAVATRHPTNKGLSRKKSVENVHPLPHIVTALTQRVDDIKGLIDRVCLHAFDHDIINFKPLKPFLYTYVYNYDDDRLIGIRYFPLREITNELREKYGLIDIDKGQYLMTSQIGSIFQEKLVKVLVSWLNHQIQIRTAQLNL